MMSRMISDSARSFTKDFPVIKQGMKDKFSDHGNFCVEAQEN